MKSGMEEEFDDQNDSSMLFMLMPPKPDFMYMYMVYGRPFLFLSSSLISIKVSKIKKSIIKLTSSPVMKAIMAIKTI